MTDKEIVKALKCASCIDVIRNDVLDLINRQKAEIERLKESNRILTQENFWGHQAFERLKQEKGR